MIKPTGTAMPRAWLYARYSTNKQTQKSLDDQISECQRFADRHGWHIERILTDAELTGYSDHRPGYQELLRGIEGGMVEVVVAENIERLTRDGEHSAQLEKLCAFHDVKIMTIIDGEANALNMGLKSLMSGALLKSIALQAHRGLAGNVAAGKSAGGRSYGYVIPRDERGDKIKGALVIDEGEAQIVRRILTEFAEGISPKKIVDQLNQDGIPSPSGRAWRQNTVFGNRKRGTGILNNELYIGVRVWDRLEYRRHPQTQKRVSRLRPEEEWVRVEVPDLRIVDDELWARVKARQDSFQVKPRRGSNSGGVGPRPKFLLSGFLRCAKCGGPLTIAGTVHKRYYCKTAKEQGPSQCTGMTGLLKDEAEQAVLGGVKRALLGSDAFKRFRDEYARALADATQSLQADRASVTRQLRAVETEIRNGTDAILAGVNSPALIEALSKAEARKLKLQAQQRQIEDARPMLPTDLEEVYAAHVRKLETILAEPELVIHARDILRVLVETISVEEVEEGRHLLGIEGDLTKFPMTYAKAAPKGGFANKSSIGLVAGVGFEPTTFRL
jgi:site-specific DNA recombinase